MWDVNFPLVVKTLVTCMPGGEHVCHISHHCLTSNHIDLDNFVGDVRLLLADFRESRATVRELTCGVAAQAATWPHPLSIVSAKCPPQSRPVPTALCVAVNTSHKYWVPWLPHSSKWCVCLSRGPTTAGNSHVGGYGQLTWTQAVCGFICWSTSHSMTATWTVSIPLYECIWSLDVAPALIYNRESDMKLNYWG